MPIPNVLDRFGPMPAPQRARRPTAANTPVLAQQALAAQCAAIQRHACYAVLPLVVVMAGAAWQAPALLTAFEAQPHPALAGYLVTLGMLTALVMLWQLWTHQQEALAWHHHWALTPAGLADTGRSIQVARATVMRHLLERVRTWQGQPMNRERRVHMAAALARLSARLDVQLQTALILAGLCLGLGLLSSFAGLPATEDEMPGAQGLWPELPLAAAAAAVYTGLMTLVHGSMLVGLHQTSGELRHLVQTSTWALTRGDDAPLPAEPGQAPAAPVPQAGEADAAVKPAADTAHDLSPQELSAQLQRQALSENELLERLEAQVGAHWKTGQRLRDARQATETATPAAVPEAQQRLNRLQTLLGELQASNQRLQQRLGTRP